MKTEEQEQPQIRCFIYSAMYNTNKRTLISKMFGRKQMVFPTVGDLCQGVLNMEPRAYKIAITSLSEVKEEDYNIFFEII